MKKLKAPVTLAAVKADKRFADFPLTRVPRLSVMPVPEEEWEWILEMSQRLTTQPARASTAGIPSGGSVRRSDCGTRATGIGSVWTAPSLPTLLPP